MDATRVKMRRDSRYEPNFSFRVSELKNMVKKRKKGGERGRIQKKDTY
jgi:hypothetical protein